MENWHAIDRCVAPPLQKNGCVARSFVFVATCVFSDKDGKRGKTRRALKPFFENGKFGKSNRTTIFNLISDTDQSFSDMGRHDEYEENMLILKERLASWNF